MRIAVVLLALALAGCQPARSVPPSLEVAPPWMYSTRPAVHARSQRPEPAPAPLRPPPEAAPQPQADPTPLPPDIRERADDIATRLRELQQRVTPVK